MLEISKENLYVDIKGLRASLDMHDCSMSNMPRTLFRGTQREYSSKPPKHSIVKRILVFKR